MFGLVLFPSFTETLPQSRVMTLKKMALSSLGNHFWLFHKLCSICSHRCVIAEIDFVLAVA